MQSLHPVLTSTINSIVQAVGGESDNEDTPHSSKVRRCGRQILTFCVLSSFLPLLIAFALGNTIVHSATVVPMTISSTTFTTGNVSSYQPAGNGSASFSAFRYVEVQPFLNTISAGYNDSNATVVPVAVYRLDQYGFSCHYSVYTHIQTLTRVWTSDLDGQWSYQLGADTGQQQTVAVPACGLLTAYSIAAIVLCACAAWEVWFSPCLRACLGFSVEVKIEQESSARCLVRFFTVATIFSVIACCCCLVLIATLWLWTDRAQLPQQSTQSTSIVTAVFAAVVMATYCIDLPLNYYAMQALLMRAKQRGQVTTTSPIRFQLLLCCYRESVRHSDDYTALS